jgi:hypothetical protein
VSISGLFVFLLNYILSKKNDFNFGQSSYIYLQQNIALTILIFLLIFIPLVRISFFPAFKNVFLRISLFSIFLSLAISQFSAFALHRNANYSTSYYFGEKGLDLTIDAVKDYTKSDQLILAAKDIGIQSGRPYIEDAAVTHLSTEELSEFFSDSNISLIVTRKKFDYSESVFPDYFTVIQQLYVPILEKNELDFTIWIRIPEDSN